MNLHAFFGWVIVVLIVTIAVELEITGRGSLIAAYLGSIILSETTFIQEG